MQDLLLIYFFGGKALKIIKVEPVKTLVLEI
jgi:hypothetical protein